MYQRVFSIKSRYYFHNTSQKSKNAVKMLFMRVYNLRNFILSLASVLTFVSCGPSSDTLASESIVEGKVFCNPFDSQGFQGVLSVNSSIHSRFAYESNTSVLAFYDVPDSFKTQRNTFIQLYGINYENNKRITSQSALEMDVLNLRNKNPSAIVSHIDHAFIQNENYGLNDFFSDHAFIIKNTAGWSVMYIGLFNENDDSILQTRVLIPPLEANPYIYEENSSNSQTLVELHPFNNLKTSIEKARDDVFLSRAEEACLKNPIY